MLPSPSSSPRPALVNCTNIFSGTNAPHSNTWVSLPTPPEHADAKRPSTGSEGGLRKRVKLNPKHEDIKETIGDCGINEDLPMEDLATVKAQQRKNTSFYMMNAAAMGRVGRLRQSLSTRPILQSFVSSHKSDVFKCPTVDVDIFLSPPYACSYSNGAKNGDTPMLAVATEHGSVHILNTTKRDDWEVEPPRAVLHPHANGIFDMKWNPSDSLIATCSGDQSTRVFCPTTATILNILRGHTGTVKCVAWDPDHSDLLSTGGRDGTICVWDLRVGKRRSREGVEAAEGTTSPVLVIPGDQCQNSKDTGARRRGKNAPPSKSVTSLAYPSGEPYRLISSGSFDGLLRSWDIRLPTVDKKNTKPTKPKPIKPTFTSEFDPTTLHGSRRPRGLISFTLGTGPTSGLVFALGADSRVHTYSLPDLAPRTIGYAHDNMQTNSFYVRVAISPTGNWLASGSNGTGSVFLYDVSNASRHSMLSPTYVSSGVQLRGQKGEVGAVDWAEGMLATCADDGSVRVWRPDVDVYGKCREDPEESKWEWAWSLEE